MATERSVSAVPVAEIAASLLGQPQVAARARIVAERAADLVAGAAAIVYVIEDQENPAWTAKAAVGEIVVGEVPDFGTGTLGAVAESRKVQVFESGSLQREDFSHLDIRRTGVSLAYAPLLIDEMLVGAVELVSYEGSFPGAVLQSLGEITELASPAIAAALNYETERNVSLHSISRVTQMYDLEKVFNSTLEMDELLSMIGKKFQEVMDVQCVNLWMIHGDALELLRQEGFDPTVEVGMAQAAGEGIAGDISENGEPVLIDNSQDERLQQRNAEHAGEFIFSLLAVPLLEHENLVGVVEVLNRLDGSPFDEDDQFLLSNICETASNALYNASLLQAERKVEILQTLVHVSGEITSTLNLDRVLQAVVNGPGAVIPYERAAIALEQRGHLQLKAISGMEQINPEDPDVSRLRGILQWGSMLNEELFVRQTENGISAEREETRAKFQHYFAECGVRAFYVLPLADEEGRVGILSFESSDPDFLTEAHFEMIKVLAGQATVALRNASLYEEVPFIGILEPLIQKKNKFMALPGRRRAAILGLIVVGLLFLAAFPFPMRVDGGALAAPCRTAKIEPEVDGIVHRVYVHEGDYVTAGTLLADLENWDYRGSLSAGQAKYQSAVSEANRALAANDGAEAGILRVQSQYWAAEVQRLQERLEKTRLRAPITGWVTTPHIENSVGRKLSAGDEFAEMEDSSEATIDVSIDQDDLPLLRPGNRTAIKLDGYPTKTFHGTVTVVSPRSQMEQDKRVFYARVQVPNGDGLIRPGMQGRGKISVGWHPVGYVLLRGSASWLYSKIWGLLGF
jgi:RND family efflux transporter MFP subunit